MTGRPYIPAGCDQQGRVAPTNGRPQWPPCDIGAHRRGLHGDWHSTWPTAPAPLDPELLLATGAMSGPHRRTRPVFFGPVRRFVRALLAAILNSLPR